MNPYWINPSPDTQEFIHSEGIKRNFYLFAVGHILLWLVSLVGIVTLYLNARKAPSVDAFTARGEPAWGTPIPLESPQALAKREEFLEQHLKNVFSHLLIRTEKGILPELQYYTDRTLMGIIERDFNFSRQKKGGYSQTFYIQEMEKIMGEPGARRRVYRIKGILSTHSLEGASDIPIYLLSAVDLRPSVPENPLGWVVSVVLSVDSKQYYNKERQALIDEVTRAKPQETTTSKNSTE